VNPRGRAATVNGDKYVGQWGDGSFHGQGTMTYANGNKYVGGWRLNEYHGIDLPPIVVPLATRVLEPWTTGEAERSPEAMVLSSRVLGVCSLVSCAA
jgi:hypothetical protein